MRAPLISLSSLMFITGCAEPTQVVFDIQTDVPCSEAGRLIITVGLEGQIEKAEPTKIVQSCNEGVINAVGTYAVTPKDPKVKTVAAFRAMLAVNKNVDVLESCTRNNNYKGCIIARRRISFIERRGLKVPVQLFLVCNGINCDENSTCSRAGKCVSDIVDVERCDAQGQCGALVTVPDDGVRCGDTFCPSQPETQWCVTRNGSAPLTCGPTPDDFAYECRNSRDCGASLYCVAGSGFVLARCTPDRPTDRVLCTSGDSSLCARGSAGCTLDAGLNGALKGCLIDAGASDGGSDSGVQTDGGADSGAETDGGADGGAETDGGVDSGAENDAGFDSGIVDAGPGPWVQTAYVKASNPSSYDEFGSTTALSGDGLVLAVGTFKESSSGRGINGVQLDDSATNSGAVYVFRKSGVWAVDANLKSSNSDPGDGFARIALSDDGNTLVVGAPGEDSNGTESDNAANAAGAVYVFQYVANQWVQQAYLKASTIEADDNFGGSVSISADGNTVVVGAENEDSSGTGVNSPTQADNTQLNSGAAYIFQRNGSSWVQVAYLKASNTGAGDRFGEQVEISDDGNTVVVTSRFEASMNSSVPGDNSAPNSGAVYVFRKSGSVWSEEAFLKASNADMGDYFGSSVSVSTDGSVLVAGSRLEKSASTTVNGDQNDNSGGDVGACYVFTRTAGTWAQTAYLKPGNAGPQEFCSSVDVTADGRTIAVGARYRNDAARGVNPPAPVGNGTHAGAVYVFSLTGPDWLQTDYLKTSNAERLDEFGTTTCISANGRTLAANANGENSSATGVNGDQTDESLQNAGAAYIFER